MEILLQTLLPTLEGTMSSTALTAMVAERQRSEQALKRLKAMSRDDDQSEVMDQQPADDSDSKDE